MSINENLRCNWSDDTCAGEVDYRIAMSPTGISYPWCEKHFDERWESQERISRTYGVPLTYYGNDHDGYNDDWDDY